jgi:hypothetical protein
MSTQTAELNGIPIAAVARELPPVVNQPAPPPAPAVAAKPKAKSKLKAVAPKAAEPSKPKILIFGKPGVGKTWGALDFPNVYYVDTEGGANLPQYTKKLEASGGSYFGVGQGSQNFEEVIEQVKALATESHDYKTLVIDSISELMILYVAAQSEKMMKAGADMTKTFGAEKKPAVAYVRQLVSWLAKLDMNVILVAHEKAEWANEKQIGVTFDAWEKLEYILHLCLNISKEGPSRKARVRKTRLEGFPDGTCFDWSYIEFAKRYGKEIMEKKSVAIELATPEQIAEVERLLSNVKLSDTDKKDKWLSDHKDELAEMQPNIIADIINHLKGKIQ